MLREFTVSNFKSIGKEQFFTMEACPKSEISEHENHVVTVGGQRLLKCASIYGPNGSGKSNLLHALFTLKTLAINKGLYLETINNDSYYECLFHKDEPTSFSVFFINDEFEIGYKLVADISGTKDAAALGMIASMERFKFIDLKIISEECSFRRIGEDEFNLLYFRNEDGSIDSEYFDNIDLIQSNMKLSPSNTFLRYMFGTFNSVTNKNEALRVLIQLANEFININILNVSPNSILYRPEDVKRISKIFPKIKECLNVMDMHVEELKFIKNTFDSNYSIILVKKANDKKVEIPLNYESDGTKKLINNLIVIFDYNASGLFLIDDLDAFLHPKLVKTLVDLFNHDSNIDKQIIFNSHDIINMNNNVFRRDEIWLTCRDEDSETKYVALSSLVNYKGEQIRKDAKFGKQYLEGRYGADPYISRGLSWEK